MATPDESKIDYVDEPISGSIEGLADSVPSALGYDWDEEKLLDSSVLDVRQVSAKSAAEQFGCDGKEFRRGKDCLIRIDYESWAAPKRFDPEAPEHVIYRREHIYVRRSDLLAEEDFLNHGMGFQCEVYGFENDEKKEGSPEEVQLSPYARKSLQSEIESEQRESIAEWLDGDVDRIPAGLGEVMQALYKEIAQETREEEEEEDAEHGQPTRASSRSTGKAGEQ